MIEIHQGDALSVLRTMPDNLVHCIVTSPLNADFVEGVYSNFQGFHFVGQFNRAIPTADVTATLSNADFFADGFYPPQFKADISLPVLDSHERSDSFDCSDSLQVGYLPSVERLTAFCVWVCDESVSPKYSMKQIDRERFNLLDTNPLGICVLGGIANNAAGIGIFLDSDSSIGVNNSSEICQICSFHITSVEEYK